MPLYDCAQLVICFAFARPMDAEAQVMSVQAFSFQRHWQPECGSKQVLENASVRMHPKYVPDRIIRYSGSTLPTDPWPVEHDGAHGIAGEDDKMSRL